MAPDVTLKDLNCLFGADRVMRETTEARAGASVVEFTTIAVALGALVAVQLLLTKGWILFTRPFWLDEVHTALVEHARSPGQVFRYLASGGETHLPMLPMMNWSIAALTGGLNEWKLRIVSAISMLLTCAIVYVMLRRRFDFLPAVSGVLAILAHPMAVQYGFEARYYAPFLLFSAGFAAVLTGRWESPRLGQGMIVLTAILLCTSHYYGVFVWTLTMAAYTLSVKPKRIAKSRTIAASAGPAALLACAPLYYAQQNALSGRTWVPSLSFGQVEQVALEIIPPIPLMLIIVVWVFVSRTVLRPRQPRLPITANVDVSSIVLAALIAMPLVLFVSSVLLQPTLVSRYAIPALLAGAVIVCVAVAAMHRALQVATVMTLMLAMFDAVRAEVDYARDFDRRVHEDVTAVLGARTAVPVIATSKHALYPLASENSEIWRRVAYVDAPDSVINRVFTERERAARRADFTLVERDVARAHHAVFGFPRLIDYSQFIEIEHLLLVGTYDSEVQRFANRWLPSHKLTRIGPRLYHASRSNSRANGGTTLTMAGAHAVTNIR